MSKCFQNGPAVTKVQQVNAFATVQAVVKDLQAHKHLPKDLTLGITPGVDASIGRTRDDTAEVHVDPSSMACLTAKQQTAVLLHEAGHWQKPVPIGPEHLVGSAVLLAATGATIAMRISEDIVAGRIYRRETKRRRAAAKVKPGFWEVMRQRRDDLKAMPKPVHAHPVLRLPLVWASVVSFSAFGLYVAGIQRENERQADFYAIRAMGEGKSLASAFAATQRMQLDNSSAVSGVPQSSQWRHMGNEFALFGIGALFTHPLPKARYRAIMEEDRRLSQAFNRRGKAPRLEP